MATIFRRALLLSSSSRFSDCESAALLFKLCLIWTPTSQRNWFQPELLLNLEKSLMLNEQMTQAVNAAVVQAANSPAAGHYWSLSHLLLILYQQLLLQRQPFLVLAKNAPMHGLLTSLRTVLELEEQASTSIGGAGAASPPPLLIPPTFHLDLVNELEKSVHFMLGVLSGGKQSGNASFADMGIAVENMVMEQDDGNAVVADAGSSAAGGTLLQEDQEMDVSISDEHSLVCLLLRECQLDHTGPSAFSRVASILQM